jgi:catalase
MRKHRFFIAAVMFGLTCAGVARAEESIEEQLIDAMHKVFGVHPGFRANHAKGIVVEGSFKASSEAAALSPAELFNGNSIPATVRFSDATGIPNVPDGADVANPHGMAIKFHLPDGSDTDMVINSLKFFSGSHRRRVPRFVACTCRKPTRCCQADEIRAVRGCASFGPCRVRYHSDAG